MIDSDSDESVVFSFDGDGGRDGDGDRDNGRENDEPPRRRMRMDPDIYGPAPPVTMTLRSGRTVQLGVCDEPRLPGPVPPDAPHEQQNSWSVQRARGELPEVVNLDIDSDSEADTFSLPGSSFGSVGPPVSLSPFFGSSPGSTASGISLDLSNFTNIPSLSPASSHTIDLDNDNDESVESFESYDLDQLSDVPVVRSPEAADSSDGSVDGASLFGPLSENENEAQAEVGQDGAGEGNRGSWQRRRLQRRNAIVLENTDSQDSGAENELEETRAAVGGIVTSILNAVAAQPPTTAPCLPTTDATSGLVDDDNDASTCLICCEPYTNSGEHRLCCLKCGHTYGKFCIEKWIKNESRCPQCNAKANKKDIRVLYAKNLMALDTAERDRLRMELDKEQEMKRRGELQNALLSQKLNEMDSNYKKLIEEHRCLKERVGAVYRDPATDFHPKPSTSTSTGNTPKSILRLHESFPFKDGECRVGAYDEWLNMLAVSQTVKSPLYPRKLMGTPSWGPFTTFSRRIASFHVTDDEVDILCFLEGCYGIKRINLLTMRATATTPLHQKEIRDLEFNSQGDVLLSVGLDKKAILTNCNSNVTVQCFNTESPLWSCAWSKIGQHIFYAGTSTGQILVYDVRKPGEVVKTLILPTVDKTPTAGIKFVSPGQDRKSGSGYFSMTGLLVQKFNSVWFCELRNEEFKFHQLPFEGTILSVDFESKSRHALISTRASNKQGKLVPSRHIVADLTQYHSEVQQATVCSCNIVQSYEGNESQVGKLTRPSIFSTLGEDKVLVAAEVGGIQGSSTSVWDIAEPLPQQVFPGRDPVLDFVPCRLNNDLFLGSISANNLNIYKYAN